MLCLAGCGEKANTISDCVMELNQPRAEKVFYVECPEVKWYFFCKRISEEEYDEHIIKYDKYIDTGVWKEK